LKSNILYSWPFGYCSRNNSSSRGEHAGEHHIGAVDLDVAGGLSEMATSGEPTGPADPNNWEDIFVALDKIGVPEDFLSSTERAQEPPQKQDFTWDEPKR
jgi:hypothetical protein